MRLRDQILAGFLFGIGLMFFAVLPVWAEGHQATVSTGGGPVRSIADQLPPSTANFGGKARAAQGRGAAGAQQAAAGAGGGGGGGGGAMYKHSEAADKSQEYGKQARESIQKSLDKYSEGVKSLSDGFKESLAAVSKLPEDNKEIMSDLRKAVENANKHETVGADAVAKLVDEIDKNGQTLVETATKRATSYLAAAPAPPPANSGGGPSLSQALGNQGGGASGGLGLAGNAEVPNANKIPSFGRGPGPFGGAANGFMTPRDPASSISSMLKDTYNPPNPSNLH